MTNHPKAMRGGTRFAALPLLAALSAASPLAAESADDRPTDSEAVRTLDDVTIEGEVRLPQVLFISSRETDRPLDALAVFGPIDPREVALATPLPGGIVVPLTPRLPVPSTHGGTDAVPPAPSTLGEPDAIAPAPTQEAHR